MKSIEASSNVILHIVSRPYLCCDYYCLMLYDVEYLCCLHLIVYPLLFRPKQADNMSSVSRFDVICSDVSIF